MAKRKTWQHIKYKTIFLGNYVFDENGDRSFTLSGKKSAGAKTRVISFESHEAAKKAGWSAV